MPDELPVMIGYAEAIARLQAEPVLLTEKAGRFELAAIGFWQRPVVAGVDLAPEERRAFLQAPYLPAGLVQATDAASPVHIVLFRSRTCWMTSATADLLARQHVIEALPAMATMLVLIVGTVLV
jgi:hypothetical protein